MMECCIECFNDPDIRDRIKALKQKGDCDICHAHNTWILDMNRASASSEYAAGIVTDFEEIVSLYVPVESITESFEERPHGRTLFDYLIDEWDIFALRYIEVEKLLTNLLRDFFRNNPAMSTKLVYPQIMLETELVCKKSIHFGKSWKDFEDVIKYQNRFHANLVQIDVLTEYLRTLISVIDEGTRFYRARIINGVTLPLGKEDMGAAPKNLARPGRLNASGMAYLYLGSELEAVLSEIKVSVLDRVAYTQFEVVRPLEVVNLENVAKISPFHLEDKASYLINRPILMDLDNALRRQSGGVRSEVEYVPTEYISDLIKTMQVDGIFYESTVKPHANDLVLFNSDKVRLVDTIHYGSIGAITPRYDPD